MEFLLLEFLAGVLTFAGTPFGVVGFVFDGEPFGVFAFGVLAWVLTLAGTLLGLRALSLMENLLEFLFYEF